MAEGGRAWLVGWGPGLQALSSTSCVALDRCLNTPPPPPRHPGPLYTAGVHVALNQRIAEKEALRHASRAGLGRALTFLEL